jgi:HD superfamily phosphodiesterase
MESNLTKAIQEVETRWLSTLSAEVDILFSKVPLPSHNLQHHLRVWNFAKALLNAYKQHNINYSQEFIEALIVAVFFHDTGLAITPDPSHGLASRNFANEFIERLGDYWNNKHSVEMLEAIEMHDDKNYTENKATRTSPGIYQILTVADDLDALGCLGLLRYYEIYFQRNIPETEINQRIKTNLNSRFGFITQQLGFSVEILDKHRLRYQRAVTFIDKIGFEQIVLLKKMFDSGVNLFKINANTLEDLTLKNFFSTVNKENAEFSQD